MIRSLITVLWAVSFAAQASEAIYSIGGGEKDRIELFAESSPLCTSMHAKRAVYTYRNFVPDRPQFAGTKVEGCYLIKDEEVFLIFADGDQGTVPLARFKPI